MFSAGWWWIPSAADRGPPGDEPRRGTSRRRARNAKLTAEQVAEIAAAPRRAHGDTRGEGVSHEELARRYGVSKALVRKVRACR